MNKRLFAAIMMSFMLAMSGCGGGDSSTPPTFVTSIPSNPAFDGDILNGTLLSPANSPSLLAGIDPFTPSEYRAFLVFPLTGAGGVPGNAFIDSAILDIFINRIVLHPRHCSHRIIFVSTCRLWNLRRLYRRYPVPTFSVPSG